MNLVIDFGNSRMKIGLFEVHQMIEKASFTDEEELFHFLDSHASDACLISTVRKENQRLLSRVNSRQAPIMLTSATPLPITNRYATPHTLGVDRIAAACGAMQVLPHQPRLVIDAGTCFNYEFVDEENCYHGGAISPGLRMRLDAMHKFTARLPLVELDGTYPLIGNSTETCMRSGVVNGAINEMNGFIDAYKILYPTLGVILCGGDALRFENQLKHPIFVAPDLVLTGLNRILLHNVSL